MTPFTFPDVSPATRKAMQGNKGKDTKPEMVVRRLVHGMGYRYRLHRRDLPGRPDLVFGPRRKVIFVHGCFWHGHGCKLGGSGPRKNVGYWAPKIARNKARDAGALAALSERGWSALVVWECELKPALALANRLRQFVDDGTGARNPRCRDKRCT